jgi:CBS domain-containing protein
MIHRKEWPQLRADLDVSTAIKILRIVTEDKKLEYGHSTPLVLDENYNLLGFVHLIDLLMSVRHVWENSTQSVASDKSDTTLRDLAISFVGSIDLDDSILKALDVMMYHRVSLVPVMKEGKLQGILKLSDIFNKVAALLFDEKDPEERGRLLQRFFR